MIALISQLYFEPSTDEVIDWLEHLDADWKRINGSEFVENLDLNDTDNLGVNLDSFDIDEVNVVWFRRWLSSRCMQDLTKMKPKEDEDKSLVIQITQFQMSELNFLFDFIFNSIPESKKFSRMEYGEINKIIVLKEALNIGLRIPKTSITTNREKFSKLKSNCDSLITKAIANGTGIKVGKDFYKGYTSVIDEIPEEVGDSFFPTLFQENIEKKFEIRSFYVNNKIYSMAIFSQKDSQTKVDFRQYNHNKPNRMIPYKLPDEIENKLITLAKKLNLNCGSFDLIKSTNNEFVFLEVNPGGQFAMVSFPCNYNLEKVIANELIERDEKYIA